MAYRSLVPTRGLSVGVLLAGVVGCTEGTVGPAGPIGPEGPGGPVGPAGSEGPSIGCSEPPLDSEPFSALRYTLLVPVDAPAQ